MSKIRPDDALERWMYRKDGMDYGPFTSKEIQGLIEKHEIWADTELYAQRKRQWFKVDTVPRFVEYLTEAMRKEAEARRLAEMAEDNATVERQSKRSHQLPFIIGGILAVAGGIAAFFLIKLPPPVLASYPSHYYRDISFETLLPVLELKAEAIQIQAEEEEEAPKAVTKKRRGGTGRNNQVAAKLEAPELDLSYDAAAASGGRTLTHEDLGRIQQAVTPGLVHCFRSEVNRTPGFEGGVVRIHVINKGTVVVSGVQTTPSASSDLVSCIKSRTSGIKVPPFAGASQIMKIPIFIQGS